MKKIGTSQNASISTGTTGSGVAGSQTGYAFFIDDSTQEIAVIVDWLTGVTAGTVYVETASTASYSGTWAPLTSVTPSTSAGSVPKQDIVQITGALGAVRTRSASVANGDINTTIWAANIG